MEYKGFPNGLQHEIRLYLPSTFDVSGEVDKDYHQYLLTKVCKIFGRRFGGFTMTEATGGWVAQDGQLVTEKITIIASKCDGLTPARLRFARRVAVLVKYLLKQEAVSLEIDGTLYLM